jgi:hypothetical protein
VPHPGGASQRVNPEIADGHDPKIRENPGEDQGLPCFGTVVRLISSPRRKEGAGHMLRSRTSRISMVALFAFLMLVAGAAFAKNDFFIRGAKLTKQPDDSWTGNGKLDGVTGKVTITGKVELLKTKRHKLQWSWVSGKRSVSGCSINSVLTRPHGIQLWDGGGRIKKTSSNERKYKGLHINLYGPTKRNDLEHAKISIGAYTPSKQFPAVRC